MPVDIPLEPANTFLTRSAMYALLSLAVVCVLSLPAVVPAASNGIAIGIDVK